MQLRLLCTSLLLLLGLHGAHAQTCSGLTTSNECGFNNCFWDLWLQGCYDSVSAAILDQPICSNWKAPDYPSPEIACEVHGCMVENGLCVAQTLPPGGLPSTPDISILHGAHWLNPYFVPNSDRFGFETKVPFAQAYRSPNSWLIFQIGNHQQNMTANLQSVGACSSLSQVGMRPRNHAPFADKSGLDYNVAAWIQRYKSLNFSSWPGDLTGFSGSLAINGESRTGPFQTGTEYQQILSDSYGPIQIGDGHLIEEVNLVDNGEFLDFTWGMNLGVITGCNGVKVESMPKVGETPARTVYTVPTSVLMQTPDNGLLGVFHTLYITQTESGSLTISPNSRYKSHVFIQEALIKPGSCPAEQEQMFITYKGSFFGVTDPAVTIGPRSLDDFFSRHPDVPAGVPTGQYHDVFQDFVSHGCSEFACSFSVTTVSECRTLQPDGRAFNRRHYANPSNIQLYDLSGLEENQQPWEIYPPYFDGQHDWFMNVHSCTDVDNAATCQLINSDVLNRPERVSVQLFLESYPSQQFDVRYEVAAGLLPLPHELRKSEIAILAVQPAVTPSGEQPATFEPIDDIERDLNLQLSWQRSITPVVRLVDGLLESIDLRLGLASGELKIEALSATGEVLTDQGAPFALEFPQLKPYMQFVPKNAMASCASCVQLPITSNSEGHPVWRGIDGYSIPVYNLIQAFPMAFQGLRLSNTYYMGRVIDGVPVNAGGLPGRRLLSYQDGPYQITITYNSDGTVTSSWNVYINMEGMPAWDPSLTYFNASSNFTVPILHPPIINVILPGTWESIPDDAAVPFLIVFLTIIVVNLLTFTAGQFACTARKQLSLKTFE